MSSTGTTRDTTPLLPWRPAILSPGCSLRFTATKTFTIFITPGGSSSPRCSFSTLPSKRACSRCTAASNSRFSVSDLGHHRVVLHADVAPGAARMLGQHLLGDRRCRP